MVSVRRGPKLQPGKRQKNGRLSQSAEFEKARIRARADQEEWDAMSAGLMARHRLYGIPYPPDPFDRSKKGTPHVMDQLAGHLIGRLVINGTLTNLQGDAAGKYAEDVANYRQAMSGPRPPGAVDLNAVHGGTSTAAEHTAFVQRAVRRFMGEERGKVGGVCGALQGAAAANRGANIYAAMDYFVLRDEFHAHMLRDLKLGLDALTAFYKLQSVEVENHRKSEEEGRQRISA